MSKLITSAAAAAEIIRRQQAVSGLRYYVEYVSGRKAPRHKIFVSAKLDDVSDGKTQRLMLFEPPGSAKSFYASHHFPAKYICDHPGCNVIFVTHTESFAEQWGRKVRNLIMSDENQALYPHVKIAEDSRAASRWETNTGSTYYATGVGGTVTGRRGDLILIDDPIRGIDDADSISVRETLWQWFGSDLSTRLKPGGQIIIIQTRWHVDDLAGRILSAQSQKGADKYEVISLPAIAMENDPIGRNPGEALWPEWQSIKELDRIRNQPSMTSRLWSALYQQSPVVEGGNVIKRDWFKPWKSSDPPKCDYILQSWDTAAAIGQKAAYSAVVTLGVFNHPEFDGLPSVVLLSASRARMLYPELRKWVQRCAEDYLDDHPTIPRPTKSSRKPDMILIERKSSGEMLIPDLARAGVTAHGINPGSIGGKDARIHIASHLMENGRFFVPFLPPSYTMPRRFADEFITEICSYPAAASRDYVDALSQGLNRIAQMGRVRSTEDHIPTVYTKTGPQGRAYY